VLTFVEARPSAIDGQHAPGLRFGDPRMMAVMAAISGSTHLLARFDNAALVRLASTLLDRPYTSGRTHSPPLQSKTWSDRELRRDQGRYIPSETVLGRDGP
jgi:hypothetical protein